jgi:hypothetical protein
LRVWLRLIWEVADHSHRMTVKRLKRVCRIRSYKTAWACWNKLKHCLDGPPAADDSGPGQRGARFSCLLRKALQTRPHSMKSTIRRTGQKP